MISKKYFRIPTFTLFFFFIFKKLPLEPPFSVGLWCHGRETKMNFERIEFYFLLRGENNVPVDCFVVTVFVRVESI